MAKNKISEWSSTAANNTDIGGIDIAEGCAPSGINNAIREMMAQVKDMQTGSDADSFTVGGNLAVSGTATITGALTASAGITSDIVGNITGNVTGNVTGNLISVTNTISAGSFIVGHTYTIATTGTTDFTLIGASSNTVGVRFTATGVGSGTGTATTFTGRAVNVTGTVAVENGGTGATSQIQNALLVGNGTGAFTSIKPSTNGKVLTSKAGATVTAGSFVVGTEYTILTAGTTDFTLIGAADSNVGTVFTANGVGTGTGTATTNTWSSETIPDNNSMTLLGTITTTSGTSATLSGLTLTNYKKLFIEVFEVSSTGSGGEFRLNGEQLINFSSTATNTICGTIDIGLATGAASSNLSNSIVAGATGMAIGSNSTAAGNIGYTTASTSIVFSISTNAFDRGTIKVYGVK